MAESPDEYFKRIYGVKPNPTGFPDARVKGGTSAADQPKDSPDNYFRKIYKTDPKNVTTNEFLRKGAETTQKHFDKLSNIRRDDVAKPGVTASPPAKKKVTRTKTTTTVTPTPRPTAGVKPKARGVQSWRMGGSDDYNPRYDPGTKPSVPKKPKSRADRGVHDFKGLKGFFK